MQRTVPRCDDFAANATTPSRKTSKIALFLTSLPQSPRTSSDGTILDTHGVQVVFVATPVAVLMFVKSTRFWQRPRPRRWPRWESSRRPPKQIDSRITHVRRRHTHPGHFSHVEQTKIRNLIARGLGGSSLAKEPLQLSRFESVLFAGCSGRNVTGAGRRLAKMIS